MTFKIKELTLPKLYYEQYYTREIKVQGKDPDPVFTCSGSGSRWAKKTGSDRIWIRIRNTGFDLTLLLLVSVFLLCEQMLTLLFINSTIYFFSWELLNGEQRILYVSTQKDLLTGFLFHYFTVYSFWKFHFLFTPSSTIVTPLPTFSPLFPPFPTYDQFMTT